MNLPQEETDSKGRIKEFWQKITNENNLPNELGIGLIICLIAIGFLIVILVNPNGVKQLTNKLSAPTPTFGPKPTPTPIPLPKGPREFGVSGGNNPEIRDLKFSEYDPKIGESQTITVSILDREGEVKGVEVTLRTDNKTKTYPLSLSTGTTKKGDWSTTIVTDDTHNYIYGMVIRAKSSKGQVSSVEPIFR